MRGRGAPGIFFPGKDNPQQRMFSDELVFKGSMYSFLAGMYVPYFIGELRMRDRSMVLLCSGMGRGFGRTRIFGKGKQRFMGIAAK